MDVYCAAFVNLAVRHAVGATAVKSWNGDVGGTFTVVARLPAGGTIRTVHAAELWDLFLIPIAASRLDQAGPELNVAAVTNFIKSLTPVPDDADFRSRNFPMYWIRIRGAIGECCDLCVPATQENSDTIARNLHPDVSCDKVTKFPGDGGGEYFERLHLPWYVKGMTLAEWDRLPFTHPKTHDFDDSSRFDKACNTSIEGASAIRFDLIGPDCDAVHHFYITLSAHNVREIDYFVACLEKEDVRNFEYIPLADAAVLHANFKYTGIADIEESIFISENVYVPVMRAGDTRDDWLQTDWPKHLDWKAFLISGRERFAADFARSLKK